MPDQLTRNQAWFLRTWVYGIILGFLGLASSYGPFNTYTIAYKVVRFLLVFWLMLQFDRRGGMDRTLLRNLAKYVLLVFFVIGFLLTINEARFPRFQSPFLNTCLVSATLALPIGTALTIFFTNAAHKKLDAIHSISVEES